MPPATATATASSSRDDLYRAASTTTIAAGAPDSWYLPCAGRAVARLSSAAAATAATRCDGKWFKDNSCSVADLDECVDLLDMPASVLHYTSDLHYSPHAHTLQQHTYNQHHQHSAAHDKRRAPLHHCFQPSTSAPSSPEPPAFCSAPRNSTSYLLQRYRYRSGAPLASRSSSSSCKGNACAYAMANSYTPSFAAGNDDEEAASAKDANVHPLAKRALRRAHRQQQAQAQRQQQQQQHTATFYCDDDLLTACSSSADDDDDDDTSSSGEDYDDNSDDYCDNGQPRMDWRTSSNAGLTDSVFLLNELSTESAPPEYKWNANDEQHLIATNMGNNNANNFGHNANNNNNFLTLEELKSARNSCWLCGCNWQQDHASLDCTECGGYALSRPCPTCDGKCKQIWKRNISATHDHHRALWVGSCSIADTAAAAAAAPSDAACCR